MFKTRNGQPCMWRQRRGGGSFFHLCPRLCWGWVLPSFLLCSLLLGDRADWSVCAWLGISLHCNSALRLRLPAFPSFCLLLVVLLRSDTACEFAKGPIARPPSGLSHHYPGEAQGSHRNAPGAHRPRCPWPRSLLHQRGKIVVNRLETSDIVLLFVPLCYIYTHIYILVKNC